MKTLAIETSSTVASIAIMEEDKLLTEYMINNQKTHSQILMQAISDILIKTSLNISDIDFFSVSVGPGSFTGLRIGVATAKSLAHSTNKPIVGVMTLDALAFSIPHFEGIVCPIIDARNNQVYTSLYEWGEEGIVRISDYTAVAIEDLVNTIREHGKKVVFVGDGIYSYKKYFLETLKDKVAFSPTFSTMPRASLIAELGLRKYTNGQWDDFLTISPFYLRQSQAERMLKVNQ